MDQMADWQFLPLTSFSSIYSRATLSGYPWPTTIIGLLLEMPPMVHGCTMQVIGMCIANYQLKILANTMLVQSLFDAVVGRHLYLSLSSASQ